MFLMFLMFLKFLHVCLVFEVFYVFKVFYVFPMRSAPCVCSASAWNMFMQHLTRSVHTL